MRKEELEKELEKSWLWQNLICLVVGDKKYSKKELLECLKENCKEVS